MDLMVVTHQAGLTVQEMTALRRRARDAGARFKVTKNRLAKRALDGTAFAEVSDLFTGPTAIAVSADPVAAAKVVSDYAATNDKLVIIGGRSEEHTSELQSLMRNSYAVFCLKKKK